MNDKVKKTCIFPEYSNNETIYFVKNHDDGNEYQFLYHQTYNTTSYIRCRDSHNCNGRAKFKVGNSENIEIS